MEVGIRSPETGTPVNGFFSCLNVWFEVQPAESIMEKFPCSTAVVGTNEIVDGGFVRIGVPWKPAKKNRINRHAHQAKPFFQIFKTTESQRSQRLKTIKAKIMSLLL